MLITGVSGFLGTQVLKVFMEDGSYTVRGTVRDKTNEKKVKPIRTMLGDLFDQVELVNADLLNAESLMNAAEGCEYIVHTASPFPLVEPKDENELIKPAVDGTMAVMEAARKHKVKRVVITSSVASIFDSENMKEKFDE